MLLRKNIPLGYVFGKIKWELLAVMIYSIVILVLYENFHITRISMSVNVPMILGTVLGLLLAFRSNQAYDRWWEARNAWGVIVNDSRSLARQALTFPAADYALDEVRQWQERFIRRQIAWCYSLADALRGGRGTIGMERNLSKRDAQRLGAYTNVPAGILQDHGVDIAYALDQGWINPMQGAELDRTVTRLCDQMGRCERIKNTVFPATYSLYIHLALNFFLLLLPFALIKEMGFIEVPLVIAIAALFLLVEKMAIHLQDPFENRPTDTPMLALSNVIERDLKETLQERPDLTAAPSAIRKYYVL